MNPKDLKFDPLAFAFIFGELGRQENFHGRIIDYVFYDEELSDVIEMVLVDGVYISRLEHDQITLGENR